MNLRNTGVLALLVILIGAYVWFEDVPPEPPDRSANVLGEPINALPTQTIERFFEFVPAQVVGIRLVHDGEARRTERHGETWVGVDQSGAIDDLLRSLNELGVVMDISEQPNDLKEYGLLPPRTIVELRLAASSTPLILQIGDRNPATTGVYARTGIDGPVILAGALVAWEVEKAFRALDTTHNLTPPPQAPRQ